MTVDLFHGSHEAVTAITSAGPFGGLFAATGKAAALSHGAVLHRIVSPRHLTDYALNYEAEGAYEIALALADGNEGLADAIMSKGCEVPDAVDREDASDLGLEIQRLRGQVAARLGYTSIEMLDEHGTTYLCLPGCAVQVIA